jgi:ubiquinone/menaquinone biosynthesis C-methylase UbiE
MLSISRARKHEPRKAREIGEGAMNHEERRDPTYTMGRSEDETRRLQQRAVFYDRQTRLLFQEAGITTGMKVLDIGSGAGDVAFLAGELVGRTGRVVGVDVNPMIVASASARAQAAGMTHVSFVAGDIREVALERDFDAVVGRLVLMYTADPAATLRAALRAVRDGGVAAFHEANMSAGVTSHPISPLHQAFGRWVSETFARSGVEMAMGTKLHQVFLAAGLEAPRMSTDALIGGDRDWVTRFVSAFGAGVLQSMMPQILQYGVATKEEIAIETFDQRYREEVLKEGSVIQWFPFVGAWARKTSG